jgi:predicted DNA-binding transcriptional regulator AlpA
MTSQKASAPIEACDPLDIDALVELLAPVLADALAPKLADVLAHRVADLLAERVTAQMRGIAALGDDAVLKPSEAAAALGKSEPTLELWRARGFGPKSIKLGVRSVGYQVGELKAYIRQCASLDRQPQPALEAVEDG